jgi:hypothetical protein
MRENLNMLGLVVIPNNIVKTTASEIEIPRKLYCRLTGFDGT